MALKIRAQTLDSAASLLRGLRCYPFPIWMHSQQTGTHGQSLAVAAHSRVPCFCHLTVYLGDDWESVHKECLTQVSFYGHSFSGAQK